MISAPWTEDQCAKLNEYQRCGWVHEFTCGNEHPGPRALIAEAGGWRCPSCDYRQTWAHDAMFDGAPPDPVALFFPAISDAADGPMEGRDGQLRDESLPPQGEP